MRLSALAVLAVVLIWIVSSTTGARVFRRSPAFTALVDPNNPDEYQLLALAYQGKSKATKDPKIVKAYNDSLNAAFAAGEKIKVKVTFDAFAIGSAKPALRADERSRDWM